ncbi:hypothetical protein BYT27DRAFT_7119273, partial [Phlegmacium glaucopus]
PGLAATHNFIMDNDPHNIDHYLTGNLEDDLDPNPGVVNESGALARQSVSRAEKDRATLKRDEIAKAMWNDYQARLQAAAM